MSRGRKLWTVAIMELAKEGDALACVRGERRSSEQDLSPARLQYLGG
jgi:hypothetical protein